MSDKADGEKNFSNLATTVKSEQNGEIVNVQDQDGHRLDKQLKSRHVTMIAIGGALGTGLLVGTGSALVRAGPASILIDYSIVGFVTYLVMGALGAVISFMPLPIGYGGYAARLVDPALGFATGYAYFFNFLLAVPNQISAFALIYFGEFEFWLSGLKVIILVGVILLLIILAAGGGPTGDRPGFRYWSDPGAFAEYRVEGPAGRLLGLWSVMITAVYSFMGTELVGVTVGETQNARLAMPKAINLTFYRIVIFYVLSVFLLGLVVPHNSPELAFAVGASTSASASPFVVAIRLAKITGLDHVINACLVIFVFSAANSDLYIAARTLYAISIDGKAPKIFSRTAKNGVPYIAVGFCALFTTLAYMSLSTGAQLAFMYLSNVVTVFAILSWIAILITHIAFTRACKSQHIDAAYIPYRAPLGAIGSYFALAFLILLTLTQGVNYFVLEFDFRGFIVAYIGIPVFVACFVGYKFVHKTQRVRACEADLVTGVPTETVADEKARVEAARKENETATGQVWNQFYNRVVVWLF